MTDEVNKLIKKAEHALEVAEILMKSNYPSDAASKIYYSMFYAAQALLKSEGINVVKHSAVESAIGYYFKIEPYRKSSQSVFASPKDLFWRVCVPNKYSEAYTSYIPLCKKGF